ncbi:MAG: M48 family metalloprotease [Gammaproteobacteria bacterium]
MSLLILPLLINCIAASAIDLPRIGDTSESFLSLEEEQKLGDEFMRNIRQSVDIIDDPEIKDYIQSLGHRLATQGNVDGRKFTFFVVDNDEINAFAGPGGYIGIHSGLILTSKSESELASVIAHEIAHVTQRHLARAFETATRMQLPATAAIIAAIILGNRKGDLGEAALAATVAGSVQNQINFTRGNEKEADRVGVELLAKSGFDPRAMPKFFERLHQAVHQIENQQLEFLQTHPVTTSRIADTSNRAEQYPATEAPNDNLYHIIKARLKIMKNNSTDNLVRFENLLAEKKYENKTSAIYGYALSLLNKGHYKKARSQINKLIRQSPENITFQILLAKIELAQNDFTSALKIFTDSLSIYPNHHPLTMLYAKALIQNGEPENARRILRDHLRNYEASPDIYNYLAQAETEMGNDIAAHQALAEYYYLIGQNPTAIQQLDFALRIAKHSLSIKPELTETEQQISKIEARLKQLHAESDSPH